MNQCPMVTVITTTYRNFIGLEKTIQSIMGQDYPSIEYIVSDDGSEEFDETLIRKVIEKYRGASLKGFQIIHHEKNLGTVKNINFASKSANGDYLIGLGLNDTFFDESSITKIINRMREHNYQIMSFSRMLVDRNGDPVRLMPSTKLLKKIGRIDTPQKQYRAFVTNLHYEMASGSGICSKKTFLEKMGYYDESYTYWEDGPYFAKCNIEGYFIHSAYDICGVNYMTGGISSVKSSAPGKAVIGLRNDANHFYEVELNREGDLLSIYDKHMLKYSIERFYCSNRLNKYLCMLKYFDVVIVRAIYKKRLQ